MSDVEESEVMIIPKGIITRRMWDIHVKFYSKKMYFYFQFEKVENCTCDIHRSSSLKSRLCGSLVITLGFSIHDIHLFISLFSRCLDRIFSLLMLLHSCSSTYRIWIVCHFHMANNHFPPLEEVDDFFSSFTNRKAQGSWRTTKTRRAGTNPGPRRLGKTRRKISKKSSICPSCHGTYNTISQNRGILLFIEFGIPSRCQLGVIPILIYYSQTVDHSVFLMDS